MTGELSGDDLLSAVEAAAALGCSVEAIEARRWRLPCEVTLKDRSVRVRRRDLVTWRAALDAERVERRETPTLSPDQVRFMQRAKAAAARLGEPSPWQ